MSYVINRLYPQGPSNVPEPPTHSHYDTDTCNRLDSEFEFESPPDFTKLGIESWTDCRPIASVEGWKVEHCTAPGSIWPEHDVRAAPKSSFYNNNSTSFLFRPRSPLPGQQYAYTSPVSPVSSSPDQTPVSLGTESTDPQVEPQPTHCNPSGYFRVQRLIMPSTSYTIGMDNPNVELRCRNNPNYPIALNETTRNYVENFLGPDSIRAELDGPERYVTHQQINLGNCTYALPYVLSRPGRFWLTKIEHVYQDFQGMNENYPTTFVPQYIGGDILLPLPVRPREPQWMDGRPVIEAWSAYLEEASKVYQFTVCGGCPQYLNPSLYPKHEDLPVCSTRAKEGARQYGVHAGSNVVAKFEDLQEQTYEWVGARPRCQHYPHLQTFRSLGAFQQDLNARASSVQDPVYGGPLALTSMDAFVKLHDETMRCLSRKRSIYLAGDSHIRLLLMDFINRLRGSENNEYNVQGWGTHDEQVEGIHIYQDFDRWLTDLQHKIRHTLGEPLGATPSPENDLNLLDKFDFMILDFGGWPAAGYQIGPLWTSDRLFNYMKDILWGLARVRHLRIEHYKKTGEGHKDLGIVWMGQVPWPETRPTPDMRTNPRL
ncbi:hypothetical protein BGZ50_008653, partial [Haplosporangium sp. Z 11]